MLAVLGERERWIEGLAVRLTEHLCHWIQPQAWEKMRQAEQAKKDYEAGVLDPGTVAEFKRGDGHDMRRVLDEHLERSDDGNVVFRPDEGTAEAIRRMAAENATAKGPARVKHAWHLGDGDGQPIGQTTAAAPAAPVSSFHQPSQAEVDLVNRFEQANRAAELMSRDQGSNPGASILATALRDSLLRGR